MKNTKIEYADHSWSPWRGCRKVSPGCQHCFAERIWRRLGVKPGGRQLAKDGYWKQPLKWNNAAMIQATGDLAHPLHVPECPKVLVDLCDPFDDEVFDGWRHRFYELITATPNLTWLILTKRPERVSYCWPCDWWGHPRKNVWMDVSVEDQQRADERIPALLRIPAAKRWVSVEPLLGPVDMRVDIKRRMRLGDAQLAGIDWIIVGGESGTRARRCDLDWIRGIILQGREADVPVFVKQIGSDPFPRYYWEHGPVHTKGGDPAEWPEDLRVRKWPAIT